MLFVQVFSFQRNLIDIYSKRKYENLEKYADLFLLPSARGCTSKYRERVHEGHGNAVSNVTKTKEKVIQGNHLSPGLLTQG